MAPEIFLLVEDLKDCCVPLLLYADGLALLMEAGRLQRLLHVLRDIHAYCCLHGQQPQDQKNGVQRKDNCQHYTFIINAQVPAEHGRVTKIGLASTATRHYTVLLQDLSPREGVLAVWCCTGAG